jgi:hypothetical protein
MIRELVRKLGTLKTALAITAVSIVVSVALYLILSEIIGDFSSKGLLRSIFIPVILCTGYSEVLAEEKTRLMGIQEFAMKPLVLNDLAVIIRRALDKTRPR